MESLVANGNWNRRVFIKGIGFVSLGLFFGLLGGCESLLESIRNRPTRRRARSGSAAVAADLATYAQAVSLMKALPASNPRSWIAQATIHGTPTGFNHCAHGTNHFFSWHRAYLLYFERICQELTGRADFGLPYWNWNQNPVIPSEFLDTSSTLYIARSITDLSSYSFVSGPTLDTIFNDGNFFSFGSQIEGTPHNSVHGFVGGQLGGFDSPKDPLFWLHHCMVDYCWWKWNAELNSDTTNDAAWLGQSWNHFVDGEGNPTEVTAGITTLMPLLSYQYEPSTIGSNVALVVAKAKKDYDLLEKRLKKGAQVHFDVKHRVAIAETATVAIARPFSMETRATGADLAQIIQSDSATEMVFASVDYADLPPKNDFFVRVFINKPAATSSTSTDDPHYAGSFAFFGTRSTDADAPMHHAERNFLVNITPTLKRLKSAGEVADGKPISVQLVAVPIMQSFAEPAGELRLKGVELIVTPVRVRTK